MDSIKELLELEWVTVILGLFVIMSSFIFIVGIVGKISEIIGKPVKWVRDKKKDHELLLKTVQDLTELHNTHKEDTKQSIRHDEIIRQDLQNLTETVNDISNRLEIMQKKMDATEMAKLKDKIVAYYRKYSALGEWEQFEHDVFWGLYDSYISHGGNSFVKDDIEPAMRKLKIKD